MNYYIGKINEKNLACRYQHTIRFMASDDRDAEERLVSIAATFYNGTVGDEEDDGFYFKHQGAYVFVSPSSWKVVPEAVYVELNGYVNEY